MMQDFAANQCRNCSADADGGHVFCGMCGQKLEFERLSLHSIGHDLLHVFIHVDRSALTLARLLLVRPGTVALEYVRGRRKRYFGPFAFLFVVVAAASAAIAFTGFRVVTADWSNPVAEFLRGHWNILMFTEVPLLAGFSRLFDMRGAFNLAEHLVLAAYATGMRVLSVLVLVLPVWYALRHQPATARALYFAYLLLWPLYYGFATSQFLPGKRALSWGKGILAATLTWVATQALASVIMQIYQGFFPAG